MPKKAPYKDALLAELGISREDLTFHERAVWWFAYSLADDGEFDVGNRLDWREFHDHLFVACGSYEGRVDLYKYRIGDVLEAYRKATKAKDLEERFEIAHEVEPVA